MTPFSVNKIFSVPLNIFELPPYKLCKKINNVAGGTVEELSELVKATLGNEGLKGFLGDLYEVIGNKFPPGNIIMAGSMEKALDLMGIKAYISVGWGGSGFRSVNNSYSKDGKPMTHAEVCKYISEYMAA